MYDDAPMEYDVNKLFRVFKDFLPGFAPKNYCSLQFTSNTAFQPSQTDYSFHKQHSSLGDEFGGEFRPGNVLDILLEKNGRHYFASIFFDTSANVIRFRLVRLTGEITEPLSDVFYRVGELASSSDHVLDEGTNPFGDDYVEAARRITDWMKFQIERDHANLGI